MVDASLTDLTTHKVGPQQQFVLFWGSAPFVYAAFVGPVRSTDVYSLTISVEPPAGQGGLSQVAVGTKPTVGLLASQLELVPPTNPQYLAYAYAPVMYGRSTSALHDVPLLTYAAVTPASGGATLLTYVIVWSHEDAGTGFLPFLEWGTWGRMTDIENAISFTVKPNGSVSGAQYLWGGEPAVGFPDSQSALKEVDKPFAGTWWGHHPVLRDATGNNDFSDEGTTPFRFQLAPVAAPAPGLPRDTVMDANPFTYQVMADEVARWYADTSTNAELSRARAGHSVRHCRPQHGREGCLLGGRRPAAVGVPRVVPERLRLGLPARVYRACAHRCQVAARLGGAAHHRCARRGRASVGGRRPDSAFTAHRAVHRNGSGPGAHSGRRRSTRSD